MTTQSVVKRFGSLAAVDGVSISVEQGSIFGIAGPNGAGKTTLFNLITGIPFGPDAGTVEFAGNRIDRMAPHQICRLGVARTFQKETAFDSLTVFDNLRVSAGHAGEGGDPAEIVEESLATFELGHLRDRRARDLHIFEKKRLMLATAWAVRPRLLLLDEPASGLSRPEIEDTARITRDLNAKGVTVVLIEHVLPLLLELSNRVMIMSNGRTLVEGTPDEVVQDRRVIEAYLGERRGG